MKKLFKKIYRLIKKYDNIVIARHIGADPDAYASEVGLRDSIKLTFKNKNVYAVGSGTTKFSYLGRLDATPVLDKDKTLLIIVDTPDRKRVDIESLKSYKYRIKIDHHPFLEEYCDLECIDQTASSASQLIIELINCTRLKIDKSIAEKLFCGLISDTNRFLFNNSTPKTFSIVSNIVKEYNLDITSLYENLYRRPMNEIRLEGYIAQNMKISENKVGYIVITDDIINKFGVDSASPGNMINNFNYIDELLVWIFVTEDIKNDVVRISIRSRGPEINQVAEKYNGGGHKQAAGIRVEKIEESEKIIQELDEVCEKYLYKEKGE